MAVCTDDSQSYMTCNSVKPNHREPSASCLGNVLRQLAELSQLNTLTVIVLTRPSFLMLAIQHNPVLTVSLGTGKLRFEVE